MAAITAILQRYPEPVITAVTHPATGLPKLKTWLPSVKEVSDACEAALEPIAQHEARLKRIKEQFEMREREARGEKPTLQQLKAKYGDDWGLTPNDPKPASTFKAPSWDEITASYAADPSRLARLLDAKDR